MPTQTTNSTGKTTTPKPPAKAAPPTATERARSVAESVVDLPVGVVLEAADRVTDVVEPFTDRSGAERQLKSYRARLRRSVKRAERRGTTARHSATREAKKTRNRVEREARKRRQDVRRAIKDQRTRAQDLVDQVSDQLAALR